MDDYTPLLAGKNTDLPELSDSVTPPRAYIYELILMLATVGIYNSIWLVQQVRDIKKLNGADVRPWVWFFVPLTYVTQIFALPRLNRHLSNYEKTLGLSFSKFLFRIWAVVVIAISALLFISEGFDDVTAWHLVAIQSIYILFFSLIVFRINRVKRSDPRIKTNKRRNPYLWWEWLIIMLGVSTLALIQVIIPDVITTHEKNSIYESIEDEFSFPINSISWLEVENEGDAIKSFVDADYFLTANIFRYEKNMSVNDIASFRYAQALEVDKDYQCKEEQFFLPNSLDVKVTQICKITGLLGINTTLISVIQSDEGLFEMNIEVTMSEDLHDIHLRSAEAAIKGFTIQ